jgi:hypothetical protein
MTISRHPGSCAEPRPLLAVSPTRDEAFRPTHLPTVSPADPCSELGPRSLDPDRCFCSAFAELIRDLSSPTDFCNCVTTCGQPNPGSTRSSQGRRPRSPSFSSPCHALSLAEAVTRGEPRYVRCRKPQCWFLSLSRACPTVMPSSAPHLRSYPRSIVRIDVHGSKDRVKDASPGACTISRACGGCIRIGRAC